MIVAWGRRFIFPCRRHHGVVLPGSLNGAFVRAAQMRLQFSCHFVVVVILVVGGQRAAAGCRS